MKLNLACGNNPIKGFKNIDKYYYPDTPEKRGWTELNPEHGVPEDYDWEEGDFTTCLDKFKDNSIEVVMIVHGLEHTYWEGAIHTLKEIYRILQPGGVVEIEVPDLEKAFDFDYETMLDIVYGGRTEVSLEFGHGCGFFRSMLFKLMKDTGFKDIEEIKVGFGTGRPEPDRNFRFKGVK